MEQNVATEPTKAQRDEMAVSHMWLVRSVYRQLRKTDGVRRNRDDLIGEGNLALCTAAYSYDPSRNTPFKYFAQKRIKSAMLRFLGKELETEGWTVSLYDDSVAELGYEQDFDKVFEKREGCYDERY